jgi:pilus assembly protein CpaE
MFNACNNGTKTVIDELFTAAIVSPDRSIQDAIAAALEGNSSVGNVWSLAGYPDASQLEQIRNVEGPCFVFVDFSDPIRARSIAAELDSHSPLLTIIAVCAVPRPEDLVELMQFGIREVLHLPIVGVEVTRAINRLSRKRHTASGTNGAALGRLYAFFPAKPGSGATTLAAHSAAAAARLAGERTLLIDFDFRLGMTSFLFKLHSDYSVLDAVASCKQHGSDLWDRMVSRRDMLDILGSAPVDFGGVNPELGAPHLLESARLAYPAVCVDLPGEMRPYELETLSQASECFLVSAPDIGSLHLAKRKSEMLREQGLHSKVSVIMNRFDGSGTMAIRDIESLLQLPVRFTVPTAEKQIAEATREGAALRGRSSLMTQIEQIAQRITPSVTPAVASKARRFIEMFSISPVRERIERGPN